MSVTASWFGTPLRNMFSGASVFDWDTDTIKCSLHEATYVPSVDGDDYWNDCTHEVSATGTYVAGGVTLTCGAPTYDAGTNEVRLPAANAVWAAADIALARVAVVYKYNVNPAAAPLIGYVNFGSDITVLNGALTIGWAGGVVLKVTVS